ncbi:DUF5060 domain-containing protein [Frigidibacter sp. ROC022]|uniref:DUF5060 domain-containing protein n=1 Tax=Frigidibacter sp. ROC022 TaxID=2971796 RepID=UPI00215A38DE|nr:DUF5060 domain-containing protein [Frigidibacter sp. ROC022]MCR8726130.1 DUF5060 domain-containing protein [Frigidibacter sp. ROC022]
MSRQTIACWDIYEFSAQGPSGGNPFLDVSFDAEFSLGNRRIKVPGFYDGDGTYRVRFCPDTTGDWDMRTYSDAEELDGLTDGFTVTEARKGVHGPVRVRNRYHFAYADGTAYKPFGTTCYAWTHQPLEMQAETLKTLETAGFNKIRMGVFPKSYPYNANPALHAIFEKTGPGEAEMDFDRPNPEAFRHFETQIGKLAEMGIEADVILFHPYDRWGYADMSAEQDCRFLKYLAARISAYRNVWWSLANEYDFLLNTKPMELWHRFFHVLEENDHLQHLRSIHNGNPALNYDHRLPWVTHVCIQHWDVKQTPLWRDAYGKPVINDEPEYEGNLYQSWGNISAEELTHRFWITTVRGGYAGHGETYNDPDDLIWWAKGGKLHGEAWKRIKFLRELLEQDVEHGLEPMGSYYAFPFGRISAGMDGENGTRFIYFGEHQPARWTTGLPADGGEYDVDLIDTWAMTIEPAKIVEAHVPPPTRHGNVTRGGVADADFGVELPGRPRLALRIRPRQT